MSESLALPKPKSRRAAAYLTLQIVLASVCVLIFFHPDLPLPPAAYRLSAGEISTDGETWTATDLPYYQQRGETAAAPAAFRMQFHHSSADPDRAWSIFIPRFTSGVEIVVNGVVLADTRRNPSAGRVDRNVSAIAPIPRSLLRDGKNELFVRLHVWGPLTGYLDTPYAGPDTELRRAYGWRVFLFATLPLALAIWQAMMGMILGLVFLARRHEIAYGWLAAAMAVGTAQHFIPMPASPLLNGLLGASGSLECALVVHFAAHLTGRQIRSWGWLLFLPAALIFGAALFGGPGALPATYMVSGPTSIGLCVLLVAAILGDAAVRTGDRSFVYLGSTLTIVVVFWIHDMLVLADRLGGERVLLGRLSYSTVLIAIGLGLTWRFVQALNEADTFTARLVEKVRETQEKLRASFAREEEQNRKEALSAERTRLMRDLHDGLGGQLVSIVAMAEQTGGTTIGEAARAALKDLRLVIDAMEEVDGDLMLVLGSWRERTAAQLRAHSIGLSWQVLQPEGLPIFPALRPWHVIQIVRLLDEAVTNAIKHAGATRLKVMIDVVPDDAGRAGGLISIEDDGKGFDAGTASAGAHERMPTGRGLLNMKKRAEFCGAALTISSGPSGTSVRLSLPASAGATGEEAQARP